MLPLPPDVMNVGSALGMYSSIHVSPQTQRVQMKVLTWPALAAGGMTYLGTDSGRWGLHPEVEKTIDVVKGNRLIVRVDGEDALLDCYCSR